MFGLQYTHYNCGNNIKPVIALLLKKCHVTLFFKRDSHLNREETVLIHVEEDVVVVAFAFFLN